MISEIIETKYGKVKGCFVNSLLVWKGIPYGKAPVGELRFKRYREPDCYDGILDCKEFGNKCWQFGGGKFQRLCDTDIPASEDCLNLNVWSAKGYEDKPVLVWIHGGGQYSGESSQPMYDLSAFARDGVVAVSFNYRLGALGFYDFSEFGSEFESNCGISDMIGALKWVHENIRAFGGDPYNVTICGESAGGTCVMALLGAPSASSYFKRAIIMSGVLYNITGKQIQDYNKKVFFEQSGITADNAELLMTADYEVLQKGCKCRFEGLYKDKPGILVAGPVIDDIVTEYPIDAIESGGLNDKELLIGTCRDEAGLFRFMNIGIKDWTTALEILYQNGYTDKVNDFTRLYNPGRAGTDSERAATEMFETDMRFWSGAVRFARAASRHTKVYMYRFDYNTPIARLIKVGATHTIDVPAAFDSKGSPLYKFALDDASVKRCLHGAFTRFISTGNPSGDMIKKWPEYDIKNGCTMIINNEISVEIQPRNEFFKLWEDIELY